MAVAEKDKGVLGISETIAPQEGEKMGPKWTSLFRKTQSMAAEGKKLSYIPPSIKNGIPTAVLQRNEVAKAAKKWDNVVVLYVCGERPVGWHLQRYIKAQWPEIDAPRIVLQSDGYHVMLLKSKGECKTAVEGGPYYMNRKPVLVYNWSPEFDFKAQVLKNFPVWNKLPGLPYNQWVEESLSRICSVIGTPMCADDCTSRLKRISYARVRLEVDVTQGIKTNVQIENVDGRLMNQRVVYEWLP